MRFVFGIVLLVAIVVVTVLWPRDEPTMPREARLRIDEVLAGADTAGFTRAVSPRAFVFPADHGPHPGFRTEWWYYTGNLTADDGGRFGFQLTFFRSALAPHRPSGVSAWRTNQVFMAHFAMTDIEAGEFRAFERFNRASKGLAGARGEPFRVWIDDWFAESSATDNDRAVPQQHIRAHEDGWGVDLALTAVKPPVLQGVDGLSQKGSGVGNASYYYSLTRLMAEGVVQVAGREVAVSGSVWMDREWSTSALEKGQVGWDWFALQLGDRTELMYYQMRREDGSADSTSRGALVERDGTKRDLLHEDVAIEVTDHWESPRGGVYPAGWRLTVKNERIDVAIMPLVADQELDVSFRYWEGAVSVTGTRAGRPVSGVGYVELTGYAE